MPRPYRTTLSPEQLTERARKAAKARTTTDHLIRRIVDRAPELTDEQIEKLTTALAREAS